VNRILERPMSAPRRCRLEAARVRPERPRHASYKPSPPYRRHFRSKLCTIRRPDRFVMPFHEIMVNLSGVPIATERLTPSPRSLLCP
jgi:hypothetical protein